MVLAAGLLFLFLIIAAVAIEVGWWLHAKRDAQNDVDAAVLAGAQELPDTGGACLMADTWATKNGAASGELDCCEDSCEFEDLSGDGAADLIRATIEREPGLLTGQLLDIGRVTVAARAAAAKQRAVAGCVTPWAIDGDETLGAEGNWGLEPEEIFVFHLSEFVVPGNFGALALYGNGTPDYKEAITTPCGSGEVGACDQAEPEVPIGGTLECEVKTGHMGQNTHDALTDRYGEGTDCDVTPDEGYDRASYLAGTPTCEDRAVLVPIIAAWPPGGHSGPIQILGIATFYIAGWDRTSPHGDEDADGDTVEDDMVWGYFLEDQDVIEAWNIQWGYSDDPFAPTRVLLVE